MFIYSCSSSGSSLFSSAPDAVVAVSVVGVSANASWSPFVSVVLTEGFSSCPEVREKLCFTRGRLTFPHRVQHSPHLEQTEAVGHF